MVDNKHANHGSQCSSVLTYTLVWHNVALYWVGGAQDDFATKLKPRWCTMQFCQSSSVCVGLWDLCYTSTLCTGHRPACIEQVVHKTILHEHYQLKPRWCTMQFCQSSSLCVGLWDPCYTSTLRTGHRPALCTTGMCCVCGFVKPTLCTTTMVCFNKEWISKFPHIFLHTAFSAQCLIQLPGWTVYSLS